MGKQQRFFEQSAILRSDFCRDRNTRQLSEVLFILFMQSKRHQTGTRWDYRQTKLFRDLITKWRRTQFRHRQATGGNDQRFTLNLLGIQVQLKTCFGFFYRVNITAVALLNTSVITLCEQHADDIFRRMVIHTEQLSMVALFKLNAVFTHHRDEVPVGVLRKR